MSGNPIVRDSVSVVIRIRNEARDLRKVLTVLRAQTLQPADIVVVDNASTDGSRDVALSLGAKVVDIDVDEFTYGRALNQGISASSGRFIVILSAHSLPVGSDFLQKVLTPFENPLVAGVRCLHAGNPAELQHWAEPKVLQWPVELNQVFLYGPIACACAIRREVWEMIPFDERITAVEDKFWALETLKRGYLVVRSEATYLYMRDIRLLESVQRLNRDRLAYFRRTGRQYEDPMFTFRGLAKKLLYSIPRRALRTAVEEALTYICLRTIPLQAQRKSRVGSVR